MLENKFKFAIDRGGTFTDIWALCPNGQVEVLKLLSEDPDHYSDAPREGIRRILQKVTGHSYPPDKCIDTSSIEWIRMGTTVATNALLERKGERMALVITEGLKDLLFIGNQARPKIFDLEILKPETLYEEVVEVTERIILNQENSTLNFDLEKYTGITNEKIIELKKIDEVKLKRDLQRIFDKGIRSLAVVLMHSYTYVKHENIVQQIAENIGFSNISLSHITMPMIRIVSRGFTTCADAYLTPCIKKYISSFSKGFQEIEKTSVSFMQSNGGLTPMKKFFGSRAILSGPAGGVVGYAVTTFSKETVSPVIGFDMGGTSTDVSRYAGEYEHIFESTTAGVTIQAPQLDINTVAAGGGSQLFFRAGMFVVGPESAGAHPGPVCYKKGGPLTVTDANLVLGRLLPQYFPKIFGPTENEPLDKEMAQSIFKELVLQINEFEASKGEGTEREMEDVALGFIKVANEAMCRPIRALTQAKGHDTSKHVLACFGGAGGQHACAIASSLGMKTVFIHKYSGVLSAYGMALADEVFEAQEPCASVYNEESFPFVRDRIEKLSRKCLEELQKQNFSKDCIELEPFLHMRYDRTDFALMCRSGSVGSTNKSYTYEDFKASFLNRYQREFGFIIKNRDIIVDDIRVQGVGKSKFDIESHADSSSEGLTPEMCQDVYFESGFHSTAVFLFENLKLHHKIIGPAMIIDKNSTILVEPECVATLTKHDNIKIEIGQDSQKSISTTLDSIHLSIFSHRFMSIAEQMGRILQRTAISTNIKERLDFSCAMFGPDGGLVANAPHIPVHLGAMQETVQYQLKVLGDSIKDGDVILSNHPSAGGSHLPDLTVITPVFYKNQKSPVFFVASRGHHADIGGTTPGSMPPHSKSIFEEGAVFKSFFLVKNGEFQETALINELNLPAQYPGCSGTRNLHDNLSDLKAQVAANQKGIKLIQELIDEYSLDVVQAYMSHIQCNAETAVREMLKEIGCKTKLKTGLSKLYAEDFMDDGTKIALDIAINEQTGDAAFDFTGTGPEVDGNCNAPRAVTFSAILYCLRCMVGHDVPLNQGCLKPIRIIIPPKSILSPSDTAAVVGGNVLTSQRVVDVVFKAFNICAASQGCMNNITFGDDDIGYYETVAGGAGAGPTWNGCSGVHTHMTNTRITDPEILERRYPVILNSFCINEGTGGSGEYTGGDGVKRELMFRRPLTLSVLTERRKYCPYGLNGGEPGSCGMNKLLKSDGDEVLLEGKCCVDINPGDTFILLTPGGGGFGAKTENGVPPASKLQKSSMKNQTFIERGSVHNYKISQESV